jgi:hypothetical protein
MNMNLAFPSLIPIGDDGTTWEQVGTVAFTTTGTSITAPTKLTHLIGGNVSPTGTAMNANDVCGVTVGATSGNITITRPASGSSGLVVFYRVVGTMFVAAA